MDTTNAFVEEVVHDSTGCALICPRKTAHVPVKKVTWHSDLVEAYGSGWEWPHRAACLSDPCLPGCHSITKEADYISPWQAQMRALALHFEVLSDEATTVSYNLDLAFQSLMKRHSNSVVLQYGPQPPDTWRLFPRRDPFESDWNGFEDLDPLQAVLQRRPVTPQPPPLGTFDQWVRELWLTLGRFGTVSRDGNGFTVPLATWFLHSWTSRRCTRPRIFHFDDNYDLWASDLLRLWQDMIVPHRQVAFHLVQPNPPRTEDELVFGHLILAQASFDDFATLCTSLFDGPTTRIMHRAVLLSQVVQPNEILEFSGSQPQCMNRAELGTPCFVQHEGHNLPDNEDYECHNGDNFIIHVPWPSFSQDAGDESSFMAMQPVQDLPQAAAADMPEVAQQGDEVEDPHTEVELPNHPDDEPADSGPEDEGQSTYLFQLDYDPLHVRLPFHNIEGAIRRFLRWGRHDLRSWHPLNHLPEDLATTSTAGIIVHQQGDIPTGSTHQLVLVDVVFFSNDPIAETDIDRTVRLLPRFLTKRALLTSLGLQPFCDVLQDYQCVLWHNAEGVPVDNFVLTMAHGDYLRIWIPPMTASCNVPTRFAARCLQQGHLSHDVHNIFMEHMDEAPDAIEPRRVPAVDPYMRRTDDMSLLQQPRVQLQLQTLIPDVTMKICCDRVHYLRQQCFALPQSQTFTRHSVVKWHDSTLAAFETTPDWTFEQPLALHFFTDGTSSRSQGEWQGASAIVLIVSTSEDDRFGGFKCYSDADNTTAPRAELGAMLGAVTWASDLLAIWHQDHPIQVSFNFDSLLAGNCANGLWTLHCHPDIAGPLRALVHWLLQCHGPIFNWEHVRAHEGHPWNEAADAIAWACQCEWIPKQPLKDILDILSFDRTDFKTVEWLWFVEASLQQCPEVPITKDRQLHVNIAAPFQKDPDGSIHSLMRTTTQPTLNTQTFRMQLRCVTANVLTLYGLKQDGVEATYGSCISARHEALLKLCKEQRFHMIGIQESRSRLCGYVATPDFHVLSAPCTTRGVGGVQLWIAKEWKGTSGSIHIAADDLKIVHSGTQRMMVRLRHQDLKLVLLVGHAPNNVDPSVLHKWWDGCSSACPASLKTWPMIAFLDANARLGSVVSPSVGPFQQQPENASGEAFHQWLAEEHMILPQTYEHMHSGPGCTWTHASGATARLDFVAISQRLLHQFPVRTQIADIDLSISKPDHNAVLLEIDLDFVVHAPCESTPEPMLPWNFDWSTDVHTHAAYLQNYVYHHFHEDKPRLRPRRAHMTDSTWQLVLAKKYHWRRQRDLVRTIKLGTLRALFSAWAHGTSSHDCKPWLRVAQQALALHEHQHSALARQTAAAFVADDRQYFDDLAQRAGDAADEGLRSFWRQIKAVLPKQQQKRRSSLKCIGPDSAELADHYCALEAGSAQNYPALLSDCFRRQQDQLLEAPLSADLTSFPTRLELEKLCRRAKNGKAPGIDGLHAEDLKLSMQNTSNLLHALFFKVWATGAEPLQYKGGLVWSTRCLHCRWFERDSALGNDWESISCSTTTTPDDLDHSLQA